MEATNPPDTSGYLISLRPDDEPEHCLPVIRSQVNVSIFEQYAKIDMNYLIVNTTEKETNPKLVINKFPGVFAHDVVIHKNPDPKEISKTSHTVKNFTNKYKDLAVDPIRKDISEEKMGVGEIWRVYYSFFMELEVRENLPEDEFNEGQHCRVKLPSWIYRVVLEEKHHFAKHLNMDGFLCEDGEFVAPYDINILDIKSETFKWNNPKLETGYKPTEHDGDKAIFRVFGAEGGNFLKTKDFVFGFDRIFLNPDCPTINLIESNDTDSCYYFYIKFYPFQLCQKEKNVENLYPDNFEMRNFQFTIYLDVGANTNACRKDYMLQYASTLIDMLPSNSLFRVVAYPLEKTKEEEVESSETTEEGKKTIKFDEVEYLDSTEENKALAKENLKNIKFNGLSKSVIEHYVKYVTTIEEDEYSPMRYIFISGSENESANEIGSQMLAAIGTDRRTRFYYVSVLPEIQFDLSLKFDICGSGLAFITKDEFDIDTKCRKIVDNAVLPYISSTCFEITGPKQFTEIYAKVNIGSTGVALDNLFEMKVKGVKEPTEYFGRINKDDLGKVQTSFPVKIGYDFDGIKHYANFKIDTTKAINVKSDSSQYYLDHIFFSRYEYVQYKIAKKEGLHGAGNIVDDGGVSKFQFKIYYGGDAIAESSYLGDTTFETIANDLITKMGVNPNRADWTTGEVPIESFTKKLSEFANDKIFGTINIKKAAGASAENKPKLIMAKVNKDKLFEFDAKLLTGDLECNKDDWKNFETAILKNKAKFKGNLDTIAAGPTRNLVFSLFCIAFLNKNCAGAKADYDAELKKVISNLKNSYDYDDAFQADANALMGPCLK